MKAYSQGCILWMIFLLLSCSSEPIITEEDPPVNNTQNPVFPPFITPTESYFEYSIDKVPIIEESSYKLKIHGLVDNPQSYTLSSLKKLKMFEKTQTTECIGNTVNGDLIGTALWKGFNVYDLLNSLGLNENANSIKFICADSYYTSITIEELKNKNIIGAVYMNNSEIPVRFGFPLKILNRGYYGVRNPSWVTEMEVTDKEPAEYWTSAGWKVNKPMEVDSKIFFPEYDSSWKIGDTIRIGGAAFGNSQIAAVDYSLDNGNTWKPANIVRNNNEEGVWVFWDVKLVATEKADYTFRSRAKNITGLTQPLIDNFGLDGTNSSPKIFISIK